MSYPAITVIDTDSCSVKFAAALLRGFVTVFLPFARALDAAELESSRLVPALETIGTELQLGSIFRFHAALAHDPPDHTGVSRKLAAYAETFGQAYATSGLGPVLATFLARRKKNVTELTKAYSYLAFAYALREPETYEKLADFHIAHKLVAWFKSVDVDQTYDLCLGMKQPTIKATAVPVSALLPLPPGIKPTTRAPTAVKNAGTMEVFEKLEEKIKRLMDGGAPLVDQLLTYGDFGLPYANEVVENLANIVTVRVPCCAQNPIWNFARGRSIG